MAMKKKKTATKGHTRRSATTRKQQAPQVRGATATAQVELQRIVKRYAQTLEALGIADASFARKEPQRALVQFMAQDLPIRPLSERSPYERCRRAEAIGRAIRAMDRLIDEIEGIVEEMTTRPWIQRRIGYSMRVWCAFEKELRKYSLLEIIPPDRLKRWQTMLLSQSVNQNIAASQMTCIRINEWADALLSNFLKDKAALGHEGYQLNLSADEFRILVWQAIYRNLKAIKAETRAQFDDAGATRKKRQHTKRR